MSFPQPRRPDQIATPPEGATIPGGRADRFRGHLLTIWTSAQGLFVYEGNTPPFKGAIIVASITANGVNSDPLGNPTHSILNVGSVASSFVNIDEGGGTSWTDASGNVRVWMQNPPTALAFFDTAVPYPVSSGVAGMVLMPTTGTVITTFFSPGINLAHLPLMVYANAAPASGNLIGSWSPKATTDHAGNTIPVGFFAPQGMATITGITPGTSAAETWHSLTLLNSFTGTGTYRFTTESNAQFSLSLTAPNPAPADGTTVATIATAAYHPAATRIFPVASSVTVAGESPYFTYDTSGNLKCQGLGAAAAVGAEVTVRLA